jgi:hypothetical protein
MKKALIISGIKWNTTIQRHHEVAKLLSRNGYNVDFLEGVVGSKFSFKKLIAKILSVARQSRNSEVPVDGGIRVIKSPFINPQKGLFAIFNNIKLRQLCANLEQEYDLIVKDRKQAFLWIYKRRFNYAYATINWHFRVPTLSCY